MKKNRILVIVFLLLVALTAYFVVNRGKGTLDDEVSDFAFKDTAAITKIFLADRTGSQVTLLRKGPGSWELSDGSEAMNVSVNNLLVCISDVAVRSPVAKAAYNNVVKAIATKAAKIEIYTDKGIVKTYYIGGATQDQLGTFMFLEGASVPFVTHIPGFDGYLTPRYITNPQEWRTKRIFNYHPDEIAEIKAVDYAVEGKGFRLVKETNGEYAIFDVYGNKMSGVVRDKVISYLEFYKQINYESIEQTLTKEQADSVKQSQPFREIILKEVSGKEKTVRLWRRPQTESTQNKTDAAGVPFPFDIDRMNGSIDEADQLIVAQYFVLDKLFRRPADFLGMQGKNN